MNGGVFSMENTLKQLLKKVPDAYPDFVNGMIAFLEDEEEITEKIIKYIKKNDFERDIENEKRPVNEEYIKLKDFLFDKGLNIYDESGNLKSVGEVVSEINKMWSCGKLSDEDIKVINKTRSEIQDRKIKDKGLDKESLLINAERLKRNNAIAFEKHCQEIRNMNMRITNWELPSKNVKQKTT